MSKAPITGKGSMRDAMPGTTAWIDEFRAVFGKDYIDSIIKRGMRGEPVFSASENGYTIGTPVPQGVAISTDKQGNRTVNHNFFKQRT
jgi:hypothetical protein